MSDAAEKRPVHLHPGETVVETRKLGLAAYIKMRGGSLLNFEPDTNMFSFKVKSESVGKSVQDWEFEYLNSCCYRHDSELVNLRKLMRR
jgi:hypothetical protein